MRYAIQTGIVFDASEPQFLLIEYGGDGAGRMIGQFHTLEDTISHVHERANQRPHLEVVGSRKREG